VRILPSGDTALLVEVDHLDEALALYRCWAADPPDGVVDLIPAACTVLVVADPALIGLDRLARELAGTRPERGSDADGPLVEVPVRYDGTDLDEVAALLGCSPREVVDRHTGAEWRVAFCGFAPGFAYLACTDGDWNIPRRSTPRTRVPAGSVGLAGTFSGVYPRPSPGGWQLIGRTGATLFDPDHEPPALLTPGTRVRFRPES
jgi:KipI family sensor histidine kinase inhibitor